MGNFKKIAGKSILIIGGCAAGSIESVELVSPNEFEDTINELSEGIAALAHSSSINVESLKGSIIALSNQGFSIAEIKVLILQFGKQYRFENTRAEMDELSEMIPKQIYIDFKPAKSRENVYRDKYFAKSTWSTQKRY